jgi:hypothetical protein
VISRRRVGATDSELAGAWIASVAPSGARCAVCGARRQIQGHHVLSQQVLRHLAQENGLNLAERERLRWDPRNGLAVCQRHHDHHTLAVRRIPRSALPASVFEFADELDGRYYGGGRAPMRSRLDREYPT